MLQTNVHGIYVIYTLNNTVMVFNKVLDHNNNKFNSKLSYLYSNLLIIKFIQSVQ